MNEFDLFFDEDEKPLDLAAESFDEMAPAITPELVRKALIDYKFHLHELNRLKEATGQQETGYWAARERRLNQRFERFDRLLTIAIQALDVDGLTDKEWTVIDLIMEDWSCRRISRVINLSDTHTIRLLKSASQKIADALNVE